MKQVDVSLRVSNMSPILELPSTILELPTTVKGVASSEIPPTVKQVAGGEQHVVGWGGSGKKDVATSTPPSKAAPAPSMPPSKATQGKTLDDSNNRFYHCAAHRLSLSMGD
jgi:hypothetical protein